MKFCPERGRRISLFKTVIGYWVLAIACAAHAAQPDSQLPQYIDLPTRNAIIAWLDANGGGGGGGGTILGTLPIVVTTGGTTNTISFNGASNFNGSGITNVPSSSLTGTISYARLPTGTATNITASGATVTQPTSGTWNIAVTPTGNVSTNANQTYVVGTTQAMDVVSWSRSLKPVASQITSTTTLTPNRNTSDVFWCNLTNNPTLAVPSNMRSGENVKLYLKAVNVSNVVTLASQIIPSSSALVSPFSITTNTTTLIVIGYIGTNYTVESYVPGYSIPPIP